MVEGVLCIVLFWLSAERQSGRLAQGLALLNRFIWSEAGRSAGSFPEPLPPAPCSSAGAQARGIGFLFHSCNVESQTLSFIFGNHYWMPWSCLPWGVSSAHPELREG